MSATDGLGIGTRKLIDSIMIDTWGEEAKEKSFIYKEVLYIIQEMMVEEGKHYFQKRTLNMGHNIFRMFAELLLYRNLANYDSMVLITSEKGCITGDALLSTKEHPEGIPLKELVGKGPLEVYSYNIKEKKFELKWCDGVEFVKNDNVCTIGYDEKNKITGTYDHPMLLKNGKYKQIDEFKIDEKTEVITKDGIKEISTKEYNDKQDVYDVVNVRDNHNFIVNGFVVSNTGKCMYCKDEKDFVVSADGNLVHPKDAKEIVFLDDDMKLKTGKIKKHYNRPEKDVFEVKLRSGKRIYLTKEHPLKTINGWEQLKDLKENDFIATPRKYSLKNNGDMNIGLVKLLAYIIADGHMSGRKLEFTKNDSYLRDDFKKSLYEFDPKLSWGDSVRVTNKDKSRNLNGAYKNNNTLMNYLKKIGLYEKRSGDKFIPKEILTLKNEHIATFLNRLYSCDGGVEIGKQKNKTREINYTTKSELMARQLQHLLLRFDIRSYLKSKIKRATNAKNHKGSKYWQLTISGKDNIINFYKNISFYHKDKKAKLKQIYNEVKKLESNTNVDIIPGGVLKDYDFKTSEKDYSKVFGVKTVKLKALKNKNISRNKFKKIADEEQDYKLLAMSSSDIFWDKIISIEKINSGEVVVYDLEVDDPTHNFVANDIIIHNSSAAMMLAREWCRLIGIKFNPERHMAYNNADVMNKIDMLNKFEPIVCDEAVRFACLEKNTKIKTPLGDVKIQNLLGKEKFDVVSFNKKTKKQEVKKAGKCIKVKTDVVYEIETECGKKISATKDHKFLTTNGWKKLEDLKEGDDLVDL